jgi:glycerophosphoryl diester phosphodiesterase
MITFVRNARSVASAALTLLTIPVVLIATQGIAVAAAGSCAPVAAHRGVTYDHTENTKGSVLAAIDLGVGAEVDLRTTVDGRIVLMHNARVSHSTDGHGLVSALTASQVRSFSTDDGQKVPFALSILRIVKRHPGSFVILDLKALPDSAQQTLALTIANLGIGSQVHAISFNPGLLAGFHQLNPGIDTRRTYSASLPDVANAAAPSGSDVRASTLTADWSTAMHSAGTPFGVWGADEATAWKLANDAGADMVITNDPAGYLTWCANAAT